MGDLHLNLLGVPEIHHGGRSVSFRTRKALALLIYLSVEGGEQSREKISALFWPESEEASARATLRSTLVYLRHALGESSQDHLTIESEAIGLNLQSDVQLDLAQLEAAARDANSLSPATLESVARLYRGDFLEGFSLADAPAFDDWASLRREYWHRRAEIVFDRLSEMQSARGNLQGALETAARWLQVDALNESAHRRLIQLHFALGNRAAALKAYESYHQLLAAELDAKPSREIEILAAKIRAETAPQRPHTPISQATSPENIQTRLVGRSEEFSALTGAFARARERQPCAVVLQGEGGIGKTRLASEFVQWAKAEPATVLVGRAFETGGRLPYQPVVEALRHALAHEKNPRSLVSATWLAELALILPELRDLVPSLPSRTGDEGSAQARLFEAVARLSTALASNLPLVLFIDDVQWVDGASLDLLRYAARHWNGARSPILVMLNIRAEALATSPSLNEWLEGLARELPVTCIRLESLSSEATRQLVEQLTSDRANSSQTISFGDWLYGETRGQPFYIVETLKSLVERGLIKSSEGGAYDLTFAMQRKHDLSRLIPAGVREVVRGRLNRLTPATFTLLCAGAVLGQDFDFESLSQVAGLGPDEALPALDEALAGLLLREVPAKASAEAEPLYLFVHDKIRDVVYTEAGEARRRLFHRRALRQLEANGAAPVALAHHAHAAGLSEPAFSYSLGAGDQAMRLFAVQEAIAQFERARALLPFIHPRPDQLTHLYLQLGRAAELANDWAKARGVYDELLLLSRQRRDLQAEAAALNHLASVATQGPMDFDRANQLLKEAVRAAEASGDKAGWAEIEWNLAQVNFFLLNRSESLEHGERALVLARELETQELMGRSLNVLGYTRWSLGQPQETLGLAQEARRIYAELGNRSMEADCLCQITYARTNLGQPQLAAEAGRAALDASVEIANVWGQVNSGIHLSMALLELGDYAQARNYARRALTIALKEGVSSLLSFVYSLVGTVERTLFNRTFARALHLEGLSIDSTFRSKAFLSPISTELCADCVIAGDWREAHAFTVQAIAARDHMFPFYAEFDLWYETLALLRAGDRELAERELECFDKRSGNNARYRIPYLRGRALLAQSYDELKQGLDYIREALALAEDIGLPGETWQLHARAAELLQAVGDRAGGQAHWRRSREIVEALTRRMGNEELAANFMNAAQVRPVVQAGASDRAAGGDL